MYFSALFVKILNSVNVGKFICIFSLVLFFHLFHSYMFTSSELQRKRTQYLRI